jgi:hypothetical protein
VALLLYLPAWESATEQFVRERQREATLPPLGPYGPFEVATILTGSRVGAYVLLIGVPLAAAWSVLRHGTSRLPLVAAALAPFAVNYLAAPFGSAYGCARFTLPALPAAFLLLGELIADVVHRLAPDPDRVAPIGAVVLAVVLCIAGPWRPIDDGPYANSYLSLVPLPAFDAPFDGMPDFYSKLEPGATIIEAPRLPTRASHLYRNYYLQHRHPTLLGLLPTDVVVPEPYVSLYPPTQLGRHADYLIVHRDVSGEVMSYFEFARRQAASDTSSLLALTRHQSAPSYSPVVPDDLMPMLTAAHGPPMVDDGRFLVYRLRDARGAGANAR